MDAFDFKIINLLMENGRIKWADLASEVGLSAPAAAERVNRLTEQGVIKQYRAVVDAETIGCECTAFVAVSLEHPKFRDTFLSVVQQLAEVQECHHIAGEDDYLLKVRCRNTKDLDRVISHDLKSVEGVFRTKTTIVMDTLKETTKLPLQKHIFQKE